MDPLDTLTVTVDHDPDGTPVVVLAGQLDLSTAPSAARAFAQLPPPGVVDGTPDGHVVVDMTDLTFMDSSGLTVLLVAVQSGHALRLRRPGTMIQRVVEATGLGQTLPVEP